MTDTEKPKSRAGGARAGAGRKPGKSPKKLRDSFFDALNTTSEVAQLNQMWQHYKQVATDKATNGDTEDYQWIFSRIMPVPKEQEIDIKQDVTTAGEAIQSAFCFVATETGEWDKND
jgi:hypothetical protein